MAKTGTFISLAEDQNGKNPSIVTQNSTLPADHFGWQMARGKVPGTQLFVATGKLDTAGAVTNNLIWPNGAFQIPTTEGVQMQFVSDDAGDTAAGTGIRTVFLLYLDGDLNQTFEIVTLNGTTPVLTTATDIRFVQDILGVTFGATGGADGTITVTDNGNTYAEIWPGELRSLSSARMVPAGYTAFIAGATISSISGSAGARTTVNVAATELYGFSFNDPLAFIPLVTLGVEDGTTNYFFPILMQVNAGSVFAMTCSTTKAATISGAWYGWLEEI